MDSKSIEQQREKKNKQQVENLNQNTEEKDFWAQNRYITTLINNFPGIAYRCLNDKNYTMEFVSDGVFILSGYYPNEMLGENALVFFNDLIHPDDQDYVWDNLQKMIEEKKQYQLTYRILTKSGNVKWVWEQGTSIYDENGEFEAIEGFITDISETKKVEEELQAANQQLQAIEQQLRASNQQLQASEQQLIASNQQLSASELELKKQLAISEEQRETNLIILNDLKNEIEQRKKIEKELMNSEAKFRSYVNNAPDGIFITDEKKAFLEVNPAICEITGYSTTELLNFHVPDLLQESEIEKGNQYFNIINEKGIARGDIGFITKSGEQRFAQTASVKLSNTRFLGFTKDITERKKTEKILEENEAKLKNIIENSMNLFYTHNVDGTITFISPQVKEILGYNQKEAMQNWINFITDNPMNKRAIVLSEKAIKTGQRQPLYELEMQKKNGKKIIVEVRESPIVKNGKVVSMVGSLAEITERKKAEEKLLLSEQKFRRIYEHMKIGVAFVSLDFNIQQANPYYCKMLGYEESELIGMHLKHITQKESLQENLRKQEQLRIGKIDHFQMEKVFIHKNKNKVYGILDANLIRDVNNKPLFFIGSVVDITARKIAENKAKDADRRLKTLLENSSDGISIINPEGRIVYASPNALKQFGYDEEYLAQQPFGADLTHPDDLLMVEETLKKVAQNPTYKPTIEYRFKTKNGDYRWIENIFTNMLHDPAINGFVFNFRDITERKKAEDELLKMEKLSSIGTLAGGIAHDFNNILAVIYGNVSLLNMDFDDHHINHEILTDIENSITRAKKLSNQLLTFSKGGSPIKKEVDITTLIKETISFDLSGSHLKPVFNFTDNVHCAKVDEGQIQQVFSNLAINASQASPDGSHLYIALKKCSLAENESPNLKSGEYLKITIRDKGKGISKENLNKIFDPYFTTKEKGNGLGLATVYSIIKKHDGAIFVDSELEKGTAFTIYLPSSEKTNDDSNTASKKEKSNIFEGKNAKRILIMDDQDAICRVLSRFIKHVGYNCDICYDGKQAIMKYQKAMVQNNPFDLIIMDLTIPGGMGGKETIKKVLEIDKNAKVVVSSGYSSEASIAEYQALGFIDVLEKPYTLDKLKALFCKIFAM